MCMWQRASSQGAIFVLGAFSMPGAACKRMVICKPAVGCCHIMWRLLNNAAVCQAPWRVIGWASHCPACAASGNEMMGVSAGPIARSSAIHARHTARTRPLTLALVLVLARRVTKRSRCIANRLRGTGKVVINAALGVCALIGVARRRADATPSFPLALVQEF